MKPQIPWLRVFVEGVVIVGSILLAFGIEAGWQARGDRNDERAYLEGLLKDVRYDRTENRLVSSVLTSALAESEALINIVESGTYRSDRIGAIDSTLHARL